MQYGITHILENIATALNIKKAKNHREFSKAVRTSSKGLLITDGTLPDLNTKDQALNTHGIQPWLKVAVYHRQTDAAGRNRRDHCDYLTSKLVHLDNTPDIATLQDTITNMLLYFRQ